VEEKPGILSRETLIPIGAAAAFLVSAFGAGCWMQAMHGELKGLRREFSTFADREERRTNEFRAAIRDHEGRLIRLETKP